MVRLWNDNKPAYIHAETSLTLMLVHTHTPAPQPLALCSGLLGLCDA